jgi:hypothetical protein
MTRPFPTLWSTTFSKSPLEIEICMQQSNRRAIVAKLATMVRERQPIIGGGAGTGLSAKCEEAGGLDLIVIYNSGRYRMAGRGSAAGLLAFGNANEIVKDMARGIESRFDQHEPRSPPHHGRRLPTAQLGAV